MNGIQNSLREQDERRLREGKTDLSFLPECVKSWKKSETKRHVKNVLRWSLQCYPKKYLMN